MTLPGNSRLPLSCNVLLLGLSALFAAAFSGCSAETAKMAFSANDTGWQTTSTYASATAGMSARDAVRSARVHLCSGSPCASRVAAERPWRTPHLGR